MNLKTSLGKQVKLNFFLCRKFSPKEKFVIKITVINLTFNTFIS
jgi:hypothetical protein